MGKKKGELVINCLEGQGFKIKEQNREIIFFPRLIDNGGRAEEAKPQAQDESSWREFSSRGSRLALFAK